MTPQSRGFGASGQLPSLQGLPLNLSFVLALACCGAGIAFLWRVLFSPFGFALRAGRDSPLRAEAMQRA